MFLFSYIINCEQIFYDESRYEAIEKQFNKTFFNLNYNKEIKYNIKPFFTCIQKIRELYEVENVTSIFEKYIINENSSIVNINFEKFKNCITEILEKFKKSPKIDDIFYCLFTFEILIFKIYLALDPIPSYVQNKKNITYKTARNFFYTLLPYIDGFIKKHKENKQIDICSTEYILITWKSIHINAFSTTFESRTTIKKAKRWV
ncbi:hypothetical protein CDIK_3683 [Cucumispora dikerogammari]|nr:hypothetical protein CDIK_3683 [Cucumispora dikerogammari]